MAITEAVAAEALKEGAKVVAKKIAKEAVKNVAKNAVKNVAKKAVKGALKEKPKKVPLYTEDERKELASLMNRRAYYKKRVEELSKANSEEYSETYVLQGEVRNRMTKKVAYEVLNASAGYFDDANYNDYQTRDFREWMHSEGDDELLKKVLRCYNKLAPEDQKIRITDDDGSHQKLTKYKEKLSQIEKDIAKIQKEAHDRRDLKIAKDLARRNKLENQESLIEAFDQGDVLFSKLSNPEKEAVNFVKDKFASATINSIDFSGMPEDKALTAKHGLYQAVMNNPMSGFRSAINESISSDITQKYGNDAGDIVSKLIDVATGKGSAKSVGLSLFNGVVNKSGINAALIDEKAADLISMGESTIGEEALKRFGRDVLIDIGKAIIKSGGNIEAAIPMAIKSILLDAGKAGAKVIK